MAIEGLSILIPTWDRPEEVRGFASKKLLSSLALISGCMCR